MQFFNTTYSRIKRCYFRLLSMNIEVGVHKKATVIILSSINYNYLSTTKTHFK